MNLTHNYLFLENATVHDPATGKQIGKFFAKWLEYNYYYPLHPLVMKKYSIFHLTKKERDKNIDSVPTDVLLFILRE